MTRRLLCLTLLFAFATSANAQALKQFVPENDDASFDIKVAVNKKDVYREGDKLMVKFKSSEDCYVWVLNENPKGEVFVIFPNKFQKENKVKANTPVEIPPPGRVSFRVRAPFGKETILVVGSKKKLPTEIKGKDLLKKIATKLDSEHVKAIVPELEEQPKKDWATVRINLTTAAKK